MQAPTQGELAGLRTALAASGRKSVMVVLHNRSSHVLELVSEHLAHGMWKKSPPHTIPPFTAVVLASQANQILRGTEWEVVYSDELFTPYYLAADNAYTAAEPVFTAAILGSGAAEPAELCCARAEGGEAAETNVFVQRTAARLRIKERISVSAALALDAAPVRQLLPRHVAEALEVVDLQGTERVRTIDGWFTASPSTVEALSDHKSSYGDKFQHARLVASSFKLKRESELTTAAALLCATPNTGLVLTGLDKSARCLLGDCVLTSSHLYVRPFATHAQDHLVFAVALVDIVEARGTGGASVTLFPHILVPPYNTDRPALRAGGFLGFGLTDDFSIDLTTSDEGPRSDGVASLQFEARWEQQDLLQCLQRQIFMLTTTALKSTGTATTEAAATVKSGWLHRECVSSSVSVSVSVSVFVCLPACLRACRPACLRACLFACLFVLLCHPLCR